MHKHQSNVFLPMMAVATAAAALLAAPAAPTLAAPARPVFSFSTLLDTGAVDIPRAVAVDRDGAVLVVGETRSAQFPVTPGALQPALRGGSDGFLAKLSPDGTRLLYATYFGGNADDAITDVALGPGGELYLGGTTYSTDLPAPGGLRTAGPGGAVDGFVVRLDPTGRTVLYGTYLGGAGTDTVAAIAAGPDGRVTVAGKTFSGDLPTTAGAIQPAAPAQLGAGAMFVAQLDTGRTGAASLAYGTYLAGTNGDKAAGVATDVALDAAGRVYVVGETRQDAMPVSPGAPGAARRGRNDGYVAVIDVSRAGAAGLAFGSYLGGSDGDRCKGLAVDASGAMVVVGETRSHDFPTTPGALRSSPPDFEFYFQNGFAAKIDPDAAGQAVRWSTYLGGGYDDEANRVAIDAAGRAVVVGQTTSPDFPLVNPVEPVPNSLIAFVARLAADGASLDYSTAYGGGGRETAADVALDAEGAAVVAVATGSRWLPTTPGAFQRAPAPAEQVVGVAVVRVAEGGSGCALAMGDVVVPASEVTDEKVGARVIFDPPAGCAGAAVEVAPASGSYFAAGRSPAVAFAVTPDGIVAVAPFEVRVRVPYDACVATDWGARFGAVTDRASPVAGAWELYVPAMGAWLTGVAEVVEVLPDGKVRLEETDHPEVRFRATLKPGSGVMTVRVRPGAGEPAIKLRGTASNCAQ